MPITPQECRSMNNQYVKDFINKYVAEIDRLLAQNFNGLRCIVPIVVDTVSPNGIDALIAIYSDKGWTVVAGNANASGLNQNGSATSYIYRMTFSVNEMIPFQSSEIQNVTWGSSDRKVDIENDNTTKQADAQIEKRTMDITND